MRAQPMTKSTGPGGRPRRSRAKRNAFADWLAETALKPTEVAKALKISSSSVYNLRNGYFAPGRELALAIAVLTEQKVTPESWPEARPRKKGR
jgi:hypothetical protein